MKKTNDDDKLIQQIQKMQGKSSPCIEVLRLETGVVLIVNGSEVYSIEFDKNLNRHYLFALSNEDNIKYDD